MKTMMITGASRGIGAELAKEAERRGWRVISLARTSGNVGEHYPIDLANVAAATALVASILQGDDATEIVLVNNAGIVEPMAPIGQLELAEVERAITINVTAPLMLADTFIRHTASKKATIINISSGAAKRPYHGWGVYGTTKAALDMITKSIGAEQGENVRVFSFYPGKVDTDMQAAIRHADEEKFHLVTAFRQFKANGELLDPREVATKLLSFYEADEFVSGEIYDIRELTK